MGVHQESTAAPAVAPTYPADIAPLRALSLFALGWVVVNQFRDHLGLHAGSLFGIVGKGYLGASLFFVLAGFVACHDYVRLREEGQLSYPCFLWRRLIRFYPLHVVALAAMGALFLAGQTLGVGFDRAAFDPSALPANLLMIHAWGVLPTVSWNFPSWLVSALWFGLLLLPATAWLSQKLRPVLAIAAALAIFVIGFEIEVARGYLFTDMTAQIGALQTVPAFLCGAGFYRLGRERTLTPSWARLLAIAAALWIVVAASLRLSDLTIWPAFGPLVFGLAETAKGARPALASPLLQALGAMSLAMSLVYLPVDIAYFHAIQRLLGTPTGAAAWAAWWGVFPVILATGAAACWLIQRPAEGWLARLAPSSRPSH
jgi:peptidoglycan/LPS O-acetylase OafA/YrhL